MIYPHIIAFLHFLTRLSFSKVSNVSNTRRTPQMFYTGNYTQINLLAEIPIKYNGR